MPTLDTQSLLSDESAIWLAPAPAVPAATVETVDDPLALALPWLVRHLGVAAAVEAVVGPVDGDAAAGSQAILPALRRLGFDAGMVQRPIDGFDAAELPAVLLLRQGDACVLTRRHVGADGEALCTVVMPGANALELVAAQADVAAEYSGVALLVRRPAAPSAGRRMCSAALWRATAARYRRWQRRSGPHRRRSRRRRPPLRRRRGRRARTCR